MEGNRGSNKSTGCDDMLAINGLTIAMVKGALMHHQIVSLGYGYE